MIRLDREQRESLRCGAHALGVSIADDAIEACALFGELLYRHNEQVNLTRIPPEHFVAKQLLDSLSVSPFLCFENGVPHTLLDLGTGAGFPGIPLAICNKTLSVTLADASRKRVEFLMTVVRALNLSQVTVLHARGEELGRDAHHRERYGGVVARAVAHLPVLLELMAPLATIGGSVIAMKGPDARAELDHAVELLPKLGLETPTVHELRLPQEAGRRVILRFPKQSATEPEFPRRWKQIQRTATLNQYPVEEG